MLRPDTAGRVVVLRSDGFEAGAPLVAVEPGGLSLLEEAFEGGVVVHMSKPVA